MPIAYKINTPITAAQFVDVLKSSGLAERRPIDDLECMQGMLDNADILITAWDGEKLVGVSRSITDFSYACYLADLAVDQDVQKLGIGIELQRLTQQQLGPRCKIILLAAPAANDYYPRLGYTHNPRCWMIERHQHIGSFEKEQK